jgi:transglutaminase-like putative cysteine protease
MIDLEHNGGSMSRYTALILTALGLVAIPAAAQMPPLTEADRTLTEVATDPDAAAVVLYHRGELHLLDLGKHILESKFTIQRRVKILKESAIEEYGELDVPLYQGLRLKKLEGRTVLPDGKSLPLRTQGEQQISRRDNLRLKVAAFDGVQVGAILEYELVVRLEHVTLLDFWFFQDRIPTLYSEMTYIVPPELGYQPLLREAIQGTVHHEAERSAQGRVVKAWAENLRAIPEEPFGFPLADLSAQFMLLLTEFNPRGVTVPLFQNWRTTCELYQSLYKDRLRKDREAKKKAKALAGSGSKVEQATRIYRFVADEIRALVFSDPKAGADAVLKEGRGDAEAQAILLKAMLEGVKIPADLIWTGFRRHGRIDLNVANPGWFRHSLVRIQIDGQAIFLDPYTPDLGFGKLSSQVEGMPAVVFDPKSPETLVLPSSPYADNQRRARLELAVDEAGRLGGAGSLELTGHHAWRYLEWKDTAEETAEAWEGWLEEELGPFAIEGVEVTESVPQQSLTVQWTMAQREEAVLGDEVSFKPSRPLGPVTQPFARNRRTPVLFGFADLEESEVIVRWPDDWEAEVLPAAADFHVPSGTLKTVVQPLEEGRGVRYQRTLEVTEKEILGGSKFETLYQLYTAAEKSDAQELVLVRR